ncbi:MAG TPA: LytTR family DNA-binding domain-containing protein [Tenuifilaceae bacterium]|nr:LytTR family DNA-binding domain-containing protein [Tenuifilaceae bacterium]
MNNARKITIDPREEIYALELIQKMPHDICYIEADGNDSYVINQFGYRYFIQKKIEQIQSSLPDSRFIKCNSEYIINTDMVQEIWISAEPIIVMNNGNIVKVSPELIPRIKKVLENKIVVGWAKDSHSLKLFNTHS